VNPENEFITLDDIHKQNIASATYYKLPFVFDGTTIIKPVNLKQCIKDKKSYTKIYEPIQLLEPSMIGVYTKDTIYDLKKDKSILHSNLECLNYYMIHSGKVQVYCVHPKYKEHLQNVNLDETSEFLENEHILKVELHPNSILFIPNYWHVCIKALDKSMIEKIQYKTPLNHLNFYYDFIENYLKNVTK
jgi:hypothetical protein